MTNLDSILKSSSVQSLSHVRLFATPWTAARQASLSIINSQSPPKPMSNVSVMPPNHLILCRHLLLLPSIFPSIRVFSNESDLYIRWPKYWSFTFNISPPMNTQDWSSLEWTGWICLQSKGLSRVFSRDISFLTKVCIVKAMVFLVVMYGYESRTIKKAEHQRIDAFELWCWRRLLRVPWTVRRSNQSILKEISPEFLLEGLMLKLKLQ